MPEEYNNEKKKQIILILVGVVTLLVAVLGATYAYFKISTDNESSNTNITGKTPPKSLVTLKGITSNLHLNISASDMSYENRTKEYYGTDEIDKSYEDNEEDGTKTIASVELTGGEATTKYSCTAKLTVSKVTEPEEDKDTMIEVLQPDDMILQFKGDIISEKLDLSELKSTGSKEYDLKFKVTGNTPEEIQAYIKLVNKETQQNYLAGKKLNIDISTSDIDCEVFVPDPKVAQLREKDTQGYLSKNQVPEKSGMYRYQAAPADANAAAQMTNWILFGTKENCEKDGEEKCTNITNSEGNNMTYADYVDKYMYRIIGITEEGQLYLIKETFLKDGSTTKFQWHNTSSISDCLGNDCEWPNADLFKRLNGETLNGNPIFVDSSEYDYLKINEVVDGEPKPSEWYSLIETHNWMYGDTNQFFNDSNTYNGDYMYAIETGKAATKRYWPDEKQGQTTCSPSSQCTEKPYTWTESEPAKISLMYIHDYIYSYPGGNPGDYSTAKNGWIHFQNDGYNTSPNYEWLSTRWGVLSTGSSIVDARVVVNDGNLYDSSGLYFGYGVRPVFYLSSQARIVDGNGTKASPYTLG